MQKQMQRVEQGGHATRISPAAWQLLARCQRRFFDRDGVAVPASKLIEAALRSWAPSVLEKETSGRESAGR
jgi:hypothetical protein